ncbi:MAG: twin-arginine translocation signal domain-containing protein, partial [Planctomycetota bacterium]
MRSRRQFLQASVAASAAIAVPTIIPSSALGLDGTVAPSERIVMGILGSGGRG